jgi:hypothetical protein
MKRACTCLSIFRHFPDFGGARRVAEGFQGGRKIFRVILEVMMQRSRDHLTQRHRGILIVPQQRKDRDLIPGGLR